jgi:hypothetical protein
MEDARTWGLTPTQDGFEIPPEGEEVVGEELETF